MHTYPLLSANEQLHLTMMNKQKDLKSLCQSRTFLPIKDKLWLFLSLSPSLSLPLSFFPFPFPFPFPLSPFLSLFLFSFIFLYLFFVLFSPSHLSPSPSPSAGLLLCQFSSVLDVIKSRLSWWACRSSWAFLKIPMDQTIILLYPRADISLEPWGDLGATNKEFY